MKHIPGGLPSILGTRTGSTAWDSPEHDGTPNTVLLISEPAAHDVIVTADDLLQLQWSARKTCAIHAYLYGQHPVKNSA